MRPSSNALRFLLKHCPPPSYAALDGCIDNSRSSHGGCFHINTFHQLLVNDINISSDEYREHSIVEFGAGPGLFAVVAGVITRQEILAIEQDDARFDLLDQWVKQIEREFTNPFIRVINRDYLSDDIQPLYDRFRQGKVFVYLNNYNGSLLHDDNCTQYQLEQILNSNCMEGSVVLALDKMFMTDEDGSTGSTWQQEIIPKTYARKEVPMLNRVKGNENELVFINWYKYTKTGESWFQGRRPRMCVNDRCENVSK